MMRASQSIKDIHVGTNTSFTARTGDVIIIIKQSEIKIDRVETIRLLQGCDVDAALVVAACARARELKCDDLRCAGRFL